MEEAGLREAMGCERSLPGPSINRNHLLNTHLLTKVPKLLEISKPSTFLYFPFFTSLGQRAGGPCEEGPRP